MLYHFNTRNLSFLKSPTLLRVLESLADHPTARAACHAAGVPESELPLYGRALATLASSKMIVPAAPPGPRRTAQPVSAAGVPQDCRRRNRPGRVSSGHSPPPDRPVRDRA